MPVKFTGLQMDMINYRLEATEAMAEVLAEEIGATYEAALVLVERSAPGLIGKIERGEALNDIERSLAMDIATDTSYLSCSESCIGGDWPDSEDGSPMTAARHASFVRSHDALKEKLMGC